MKTILATIGSGYASLGKTQVQHPAPGMPTIAPSTTDRAASGRVLVAGMVRGMATILRVAATVFVCCVFSPVILLAWLAVGLDKMARTNVVHTVHQPPAEWQRITCHEKDTRCSSLAHSDRSLGAKAV
jgi:hypothetical protein